VASDQVVTLRPYSCDAWLALVPLRYESSDLDGAAAAADQARHARPGRADAMVAAAELAWRRGEPERADSLFRLGIPRLAPDVRALFEDIAPFATAAEGNQLAALSGPERATF